MGFSLNHVARAGGGGGGGVNSWEGVKKVLYLMNGLCV